MDWFLYDNGLRHERVNHNSFQHVQTETKMNAYLHKIYVVHEDIWFDFEGFQQISCL